MATPWAPERVVSPTEAVALIGDQMPDLRPVTLGRCWAGWDNTVYEVNRALVFRFPRRAVAVGLLATEIEVLPAIAPHVPIPISVPERIGQSTEVYPWPFAGYRRLAGDTADRARLDPSQRLALAAPLGRFLAALHAIDPAGLALSDDVIGRLAFGPRMQRFRDRAGVAGLATTAAWAVELEAAPLPRARAVVHGDLYARAILVDGPAISGIIDWGDLHRGDPAVDLAGVHGFLPPAAHAEFRAAYGPIDDDTWRLARLRAIVHTTTILAYAIDAADPELEREARVAISHLTG